jgi:hypothetical protein
VDIGDGAVLMRFATSLAKMYVRNTLVDIQIDPAELSFVGQPEKIGTVVILNEDHLIAILRDIEAYLLA